MATKRKRNKGSRVMKALKKYVKKATGNPKRVKVYEIYYSYGGRGSAGAVRATSKYEAIYKAVMQWGGRSKDYRAVEEVSNPKRIKGAKVKGGRSVTLTNFTGRVIRKRNGQVQIIGRIKKR